MMLCIASGQRQTKNDVSEDGLNFEESTSDGALENPDGFNGLL